VHVRNTGKREGAEVVQVYLHDAAGVPGSSVDQSLAGFAKVSLSPAEDREVIVELEPRAFAHYDLAAHDWRRPPGRFEIRVGTSSRDIRLRTLFDVSP
jgi:beta-glucosidase